MTAGTMTNSNVSEDAVSHFSRTARQFHDHYRDSPEFQERVEIWDELLGRYAGRQELAVDMGCGSGIFSFRLAETSGRVVGIDGAPDMIAFCEHQRAERGIDHLRFVEARLPVVEEALLAGADVVVSSSVVEYVPDLGAVLSLFSRILRPGGTLIMSMPNVYSISRRYERTKYALTGEPGIYRHILHFSSPSRLARRMRMLGLIPLESRYYSHRTRLAGLMRTLRFPDYLTEDLFVSVFRKQPGG
jgi:2-polyprenyl-3-methyl-5-hydroxy-6-metoxy-1,4-benzoquinol methylase